MHLARWKYFGGKQNNKRRKVWQEKMQRPLMIEK